MDKIYCVNESCPLACHCGRSAGNLFPSNDVRWTSCSYMEPESQQYCRFFTAGVDSVDKLNTLVPTEDDRYTTT